MNTPQLNGFETWPADLPRKRFRKLRAATSKVLARFGFDTRDWARVVLYDRCDSFMRETFDFATANVLAVSSASHFSELGFRNFKATQFPEFDVCHDRLDEKFDLIIADQILEHVRYPQSAVKNMYAMLSPGGWALIATPFLIKVHKQPLDAWRWTEDGLRYLLEDCGFDDQKIRTDAWGNREYLIKQAILPWWPHRGFGSLRNDKEFPVTVWAFARK